MSTDTPAPPRSIEIRKYPNRRYYDATRSRHLTLEGIRTLIREGCNVRVVDSQTSADITGKVLTQIILELDAPKLEIFPAGLLAEMIRVNDGLAEGFFEKFLSQAFDGFMEYQRQLGAQLQPATGWQALLSPLAAWTRAMGATPANPPPPPPVAGQTGTGTDAGLSASMERLRRRVQSLERQLAANASRPRRGASRRPPRKAS